jgi:hypothetical protein
MASADGPADRAAAHAMGWRTFTVTPVGVDGDAGDVRCPSPRVGCADCRLCGGLQREGAKSVWIHAHGSQAKARENDKRGLLRIMQ